MLCFFAYFSFLLSKIDMPILCEIDSPEHYRAEPNPFSDFYTLGQIRAAHLVGVCA